MIDIMPLVKPAVLFCMSNCGPSEGPFVHINDRYIIILETNLMVMRHIDRACRCNLDYFLANDCTEPFTPNKYVFNAWL